MKRIVARLGAAVRQLRWKLTLSYMLVTVAAMLVVELVVILLSSFYIANESLVRPLRLLQELEGRHVPAASVYLSEIPPNIQGLRSSLSPVDHISIETRPIRIGNFLFSAYSTNLLSVVFLGPNGVYIDSLPHDFIQGLMVGERFDAGRIPGLEQPLQAALAGETDYNRLYATSGRNRMVGAVPIFDELGKGRVVGALAFVQKLDFWEVWTFPQIARQIGVSLLFITGFAALMGSGFGSQTSRSLVERLKELLAAAQAWSRGDFSVFAQDPSRDELGRLARGLNHMAAEMENLLAERQERSVIEERNRLARDLHDSVKQQAFAASAQLAAARAHFKLDPAEAERHLLETERLLYAMRQELSDLIQELRPAALQGQGLARALREYAQDCAKRAGIDIEVRVQGERSLPLEMEQTLFRIAQGALSNVVRHSQATRAEVHLVYGRHTVALRVSDDGRGFESAEWRHGLGLRLMRERAQMLKGNFILRSEPGKGTEIAVKCGLDRPSPLTGRG